MDWGIVAAVMVGIGLYNIATLLLPPLVGFVVGLAAWILSAILGFVGILLGGIMHLVWGRKNRKED